MSDIKMSDRPLWIDKNGHRTLDNWSKQAMAYHHCEDVKCLREDNDTLVAQNLALKAALERILKANKNDSFGGFLTFEEIEDGLKALEGVGDE